MQKKIDRNLRVIYSDKNTVRKILVQRDAEGTLIIRLDEVFKDAPTEIIEILADYIKSDSDNSKNALIYWFIENKKASPVKASETPFENNFNALVENFFPKIPEINLIWGKRSKFGQQKSIRLASFWPRKREIVIHPFLENPDIPLFYIEYLLFHELCHAYLIFTNQVKESESHGPLFAELESKFPEIKESLQWEKEELPELLDSFFSET